jgi:hypothetical protein
MHMLDAMTLLKDIGEDSQLLVEVISEYVSN